MKLVHYIIVVIALVMASILAFAVVPAVSAQQNSGNISQQSSKIAEQSVAQTPLQIMVMIEQPANRLRSSSGYSAGYGDARQKAIRSKLGRKIAKKYGLKFIDNWPMPLLNIECFIMELPAGKQMEGLIAEISDDQRVSWAEPMSDYGVLSASTSYNDPLYAVSPAAHKWNIADLHREWTGRNVSIAIVDTQIDKNHPDLLGRVSLVKNFTNLANSSAELHGTSVAGVIGATANNGIGIAGVAPNSNLLGLRACWHNRKTRRSICNTLSLARAINYAVEKKVDIINLSLGGPPSTLLTKLINVATKSDITIVAAYNEKLPAGGFPASHKQVIAVSRDDESFVMNRGFKAPGNDIPTTKPGGQWYLADGSSYAAAHVTGLLALMHQCRKASGRNCKNLVTRSDSSFIIDAKASLR